MVGTRLGTPATGRGKAGKRRGGEGRRGSGSVLGVILTEQLGTNWIGFLSQVSFKKKNSFIWVHQVLAARCEIFQSWHVGSRS